MSRPRGRGAIRVERVEIKDVSLPESMKRSMSRQAEAERERRARIITADGEYQASKRLAAAANVMARDPAALAAAAAADRGRGGRGEEQHAGHAGTGRAAAVLRQDDPPGAGGRSRSRRRTRPRWPTSATRTWPGRRGGNRERSAARDTRGPAGARARRARGACPSRGGGSGGGCQLQAVGRRERPPSRQPGRSRIPNDPPAGSPAPGASPACWRALGRRRDHALGWRHDEVGVRDGAAARARDQADP